MPWPRHNPAPNSVGFGVDPLHPVVAGHRETVVAVQDEVEAPYLLEAHRR